VLRLHQELRRVAQDAFVVSWLRQLANVKRAVYGLETLKQVLKAGLNRLKAFNEVGVNEHQRVDVGRHLRMVAADPMQQLCPFLLSLGAGVVEEGKGQRVKVTKARPVIMIQELGQLASVKLLDSLEAFAWRNRQRVRLHLFHCHKSCGHEDEFGTADTSLEALDEKPVIFVTKVLEVRVLQQEVLALSLWDLESLQSSIS
jgi:hypothetical protein